MAGYCRWYDKPSENISEPEQLNCESHGRSCLDCQDLVSESEFKSEQFERAQMEHDMENN